MNSTVSLLRINAEVSLHVSSFLPPDGCHNSPVLMVGGLATLQESFREIIEELAQDFPVHYIETREKSGSHINGKVGFDIGSMAEDIAKITELLGMEECRYVFIGYSMGATVVADCYRFLKRRPRCILFMEPTPVFHYPKWSIPVIRWLGVPLYSILVPFVKWYLRKFHINVSEDAEMAVISFRALDNADPRKLRNTVIAIADYKIWDRLKEIDCPTLVVGASKDRFHVEEEIKRMVSGIRGCRYVDLETNLRTHSAEMAHVIRGFIGSLPGPPQ